MVLSVVTLLELTGTCLGLALFQDINKISTWNKRIKLHDFQLSFFLNDFNIKSLPLIEYY